MPLLSKWVDDLGFEEACESIRTLRGGGLSEDEVASLLTGLERNFPDGNPSDLIYWPNEWFEDESMFHVELSTEQIVGYLMARSGRRLRGAPQELPLPFPLPHR